MLPPLSLFFLTLAGFFLGLAVIILIKELLIAIIRIRVRKFVKQAKLFKSEDILVTFGFVKKILLNQNDKTDIGEFTKLEGLIVNLNRLEEKLIREELASQNWNFKKTFYRITKKVRKIKLIYNNFLKDKLKFEDLSNKITSVFKVCEGENVRYNLIYDNLITPKILPLLNQPSNLLGELIESEVDNWVRLKNEYDNALQKRVGQHLIKNLRAQRITLSNLIILTTKLNTLERLKSELIPQSLQTIKKSLASLPETKLKQQMQLKLKSLGGLKKEFEREFFMGDALLTIIRANQLVNKINQLYQELEQEKGFKEILERNLDELVDYIQKKFYNCSLFLRGRERFFPEINSSLKKLRVEFEKGFKEADRESANEWLNWFFQTEKELSKITKKVATLREEYLKKGNLKINFQEQFKRFSSNLLILEEAINSGAFKLNKTIETRLQRIKQNLNFVNRLSIVSNEETDKKRISQALEKSEGDINNLIIWLSEALVSRFLKGVLLALAYNKRKLILPFLEEINKLEEKGEYQEALRLFPTILKKFEY